MKPQYIYFLAPAEGDKGYVGKTNDLASRLNSHQKSGRNVDTMFVLQRLDCCEHGEDSAAERHWIAVFGRENLTNQTNGGEGTNGWAPSQETRAKMSAATSTRYQDPAARAKQSAACKGRKFSHAHRAALSAVHKGVKLSPSHCAAMSAGRKGMKLSPSHRAALSTMALKREAHRQILRSENTS